MTLGNSKFRVENSTKRGFRFSGNSNIIEVDNSNPKELNILFLLEYAHLLLNFTYRF